jgi:hypothetical protein
LPSRYDTNKDIKYLGIWLINQRQCYKNQTGIFKKIEIRTYWEEFINNSDYSKFFEDNDTIWNNNLEKLKSYIDINHKRPTGTDSNSEIKALSDWLSSQLYNIKNNKGNTLDHITQWEEFINNTDYSKYFEDNVTVWNNYFKELKNYIDENDKLPSRNDTINKIKILGNWCNAQIQNYTKVRYIMKIDNNIYQRWLDFINDTKYKQLFVTRAQEWENMLNKTKNYINEYDKTPQITDDIKEISDLGTWLSHQKQNYKNNIKSMKNLNIKKLWEEFINDDKYRKYFDDNYNWIVTLEKVKNYIDTNYKTPSTTDKNEDINYLGNWLCRQRTYYKNKQHVMLNNEIIDLWLEFIEQYKEYLLDTKSLWFIKLDKLKEYIEEYNKLPSQVNKNQIYASLGSWVSGQKKIFRLRTEIMKNDEIYASWSEFIKDKKYFKFFLADEDIWIKNLIEVKKYIDVHKTKPSYQDNNDEIKRLGRWIGHQQKNFKQRNCIMKHKNIYDKWNEFINNKLYYTHFLTKDKKWDYMLNEYKSFIDKNQRIMFDKERYEPDKKQLFGWSKKQISHYKLKKEYFMENHLIKWEDFINDPKYSKFFAEKPAPKSVYLPKPPENPHKSPTSHKRPPPSHYQEIGKKMSTQTSCNTSTMFKDSEQLWHDYHNARDHSFKGYLEQDLLPVNTIIEYLETKKKYKMNILDLGCGRNEIYMHFKDYEKFTITGYDHVSYNDSISQDISHLPVEDGTINICIYSQSLMGSNWNEYLKEGQRVLGFGGEMIIVESIERYDIIKKYIEEELGMMIKNERSSTRWFYMYVTAS